MSLLANFIGLCTLLVLPSSQWSLYVMMVAFLVLGLASSGRASIGYCYFVELAPKRYADMMGTWWNIAEAFVYILLTIYFAYISKNWFWTIAFGTFLSAVTLVTIFLFVPESPKWLFDKKRYVECQDVL